MSPPKNKKKSPVILFGVGFAIVVLATLIANWQSALVRELQFPLNNGVSKLLTYGHFLAAVSQDNRIYIWDWSDLSGKPTVGIVPAEQAVLVAPDTAVSVGRMRPEAVFVGGVAEGENHKRIALGGTGRRAWLASSRNKATVVVAIEQTGEQEGGQVEYKLLRIDWDALRAEPIAEIAGKPPKRLMNLAVSDDGRLVFLMGQQNKNGWMALVDINDTKVVWDKQAGDLEKIGNAEFSPDGRFVYARAGDSTLYKIETSSGRIADRWPATKSNPSTLGQTSVQEVAVSPDGRVAAWLIVSACRA